MPIDITFNFYSDSKGPDPDKSSPTLRRYHKELWCKQLPCGKLFELSDDIKGAYLYHNSDIGEFYLGSDSITHSYKSQKRKKWLTEQIPTDVDEIFNAGSTIGGFILFPNKSINRKNTINQARGVNPYIDDRFDLTLECIRLFYLDQQSPLYDTLHRYKSFFELFEDFRSYVNFFQLNDLVDENENVKFYLPFDNFLSKPKFSSVDDYLIYKSNVIRFIELRNQRIEHYAKSILISS
jgi:hypothetical protein